MPLTGSYLPLLAALVGLMRDRFEFVCVLLNLSLIPRATVLVDVFAEPHIAMLAKVRCKDKTPHNIATNGLGCDARGHEHIRLSIECSNLIILVL